MSETMGSSVRNISFFILSIAACILATSYLLRTLSVIERNKHEYQLIQLGEYRRDQYLLDKKTGRTWVSVCTGESKNGDCTADIMWQERLAIGLNGYTHDDYFKYLEYLASIEKQPSKEKTK